MQDLRVTLDANPVEIGRCCFCSPAVTVVAVSDNMSGIFTVIGSKLGEEINYDLVSQVSQRLPAADWDSFTLQSSSWHNLPH